LAAGVNLMLQPSTFANAPLSGYARLTAAKGSISDADVDLHLASNSLQAKGSFGSALDKLEWKLDAPQLGALGPQFGGALRANGTLSGTSARPALALTLNGSNLRTPGQQEIGTIAAAPRWAIRSRWPAAATSAPAPAQRAGPQHAITRRQRRLRLTYRWSATSRSRATSRQRSRSTRPACRPAARARRTSSS
jgi:translocation and assembly module TamB